MSTSRTRIARRLSTNQIAQMTAAIQMALLKQTSLEEPVLYETDTTGKIQFLPGLNAFSGFAEKVGRMYSAQ